MYILGRLQKKSWKAEFQLSNQALLLVLSDRTKTETTKIASWKGEPINIAMTIFGYLNNLERLGYRATYLNPVLIESVAFSKVRIMDTTKELQAQ